ncbi:RNA polymerase sigma-70 factor, ECF subfamily [Chitinophaga sp. CF118]|uniref:RNA polymerase sigma-70 factor n=1 Tax=Chitinophaga sp. CF118 TaxID=1884367 RepID=UPI0008EF9263|nr:RNA polymerase sigma-70 factor [Chitinophaga sp. CF118]SFE60102.1 RNA polymerase sigma-70 factor, ECF subfamily [Chitinophaga sp. CF118]
MRGENLLNETVLLARIAGGDECAFREVFDYYQRYVFTFAQKITRSGSDAEEIVQDIFLKVWFNRNQLPAIENFGAYLNRLVRNHAFNLLRHEAIVSKVKTEMGLNSSDNDLGTQQALDYKETRELLDDVVSRLPEQQRRVYTLCHHEGLKYDEVAAQLNISPDTVHYHMKLALATIREHFKRHALVYPGLFMIFLN